MAAADGKTETATQLAILNPCNPFSFEGAVLPHRGAYRCTTLYPHGRGDYKTQSTPICLEVDLLSTFVIIVNSALSKG